MRTIFSAHETSLARSNLYTLLSQLYLRGLTPDLLPFAQSLPELAVHLPATFIAEESAAQHHHIFGFSIFPYESIFLGDGGSLGGPMTEAVQQTYARLGYTAEATAVSPDHLSAELGLLAFLAGAEADAWQDGQNALAQRMQREQLRFLEEHLLRWLVPCMAAVMQQKNPFFGAVALLTVEVVDDHYRVRQPVTQPSLAWTLPTPPNLLQDEKTNLRDIAAYLTMPAYCGGFLSRDDIERMGREQRLPRGFGGRTQMLLNLLRSAAQYEGVAHLLDALRAVVTAWTDAYATLAADAPGLAPFIQPWQEQTHRTLALFNQMKNLVHRQAE